MPLPRKTTTLLAVLTMLGALSYSAGAIADEPPPAPTPADSGGRHHNPAFAACKQKADDQKIAPGDARRAFIKNCMKSAAPSS
jgi:hypothetical protein